MTGLPDSLARLQRLLAEPSTGARVVRGRAGVAGRRAAVLIPFFQEAPVVGEAADVGGLRLVVIEKSPLLRRHAGQVAFPGGGVEARDASSEETALREAREEVGIEPDSVDLLGVLPPAEVAATGYNVTSVVGYWREPRPLEVVDAGEIAAVHTLAVSDLVEPGHRLTWVHPLGYTGPAFLAGELFIWGFTGHLLDGLLRVAGWERPWDAARRAEVPERFLHRRGRDTGQ